ncbi:MAG: hypothetical protein MUC68_10810 [Burkholderiaceae bacterium]|nr:hypothetical protein [Burkholderiaceae bacterium]
MAANRSPAATSRKSPPQRAAARATHDFARAWIVDRADAADLLLHPLNFRFIAPFVARSLSVAQAAAELSVSASRVRYWVARGVAAGLLLAEPGDSRAQRYRTRADVLFLPARLTEAGTTEALASAWSDPWQAMFVRSVARVLERTGAVGVRIFRDADGVIDSMLARGPTHDIEFDELPPLCGGWMSNMWLDEPEARQLQRELNDLVRRYATRRDGRDRYLMRLALAPLLEPDILPGYMPRTAPATRRR